MNLNIIGGGFTGCILALIKCNQFEKINIFESSSSLGGVLKDDIIKNNCFFRGCQYLDPETEWFKKLNKIQNLKFTKFQHVYGSYTHLDDEVFISNSVAGPIFSFDRLDLDEFNLAELTNESSILDKFNRYPEFIKNNLIKWFNQFGVKNDSIHFQCLESIQLSRIFFNKSHDIILKLKKKNNLLNKIIGVPRNLIFDEKINAVIPKFGYDNLFSNLKKYFEKDKNIQVKLNYKYKDFSFVDNFDQEKNLYLWAGNPIPLIRKLKSIKISNPFFKIKFYHFNIIDKFDDKNLYKYIQVYSNKDKILRIYIYQIGQSINCTVEAFYNSTQSEIEYSLNKILEQFNIMVKLDLKYISSQIRHLFYTIDDKKVFDDFYHQNVINGAWDVYSKNQKINRIVRNVSKYIR